MTEVPPPPPQPQPTSGGAEPPVIDIETIETDLLEANYVHISEMIHADGTPELVITNSEMLTPWAMLGMLQAALDFQKTVTTNIFYGASYEDMRYSDDDDACFEGACDCEDDDETGSGPFG